MVHDKHRIVKVVSQTDGNNMNGGLFLGYTHLQVVDGVVVVVVVVETWRLGPLEKGFPSKR